MLNTGNLLGNIFGSNSQSSAVPTNTATPYNANIAPSQPMATSVSTKQPVAGSITGLIPLTPPPNPNADALTKIHAATIKAVNAPQTAPASSTNQSTPTSGGASIFSLTPAQIAAAQTPAQYAASTGQTPTPSTGGTPETGTYTSPGNPLIAGLANASSNPNPLISSIASQEAALANQYAPAFANAGNAPGIAGAQEARQSNLAQAEGAQMQGLAAAGSTANTAQANIQSGLSSAAGLANPTGSFPFSYNPATGQFTNASGSVSGSASGTSGAPTLTYNPQIDAATLAKAVIAHTISAQDAITALSYGSNGPNAAGQLSTAVLAQGGNLANIEAQTSANQQNINTSSTAETNAQANLINTQVGNIGAMSAVRDSVANLSNQLISYLGTNNGLNPSNINAINGVAQTIAANTSNPQYKTLQNLMTDIAGKYANILVPGGASTDYTQGLSQGMINQLAQGSTISQVIGGLDAQAQGTIAGAQTALQATESGTNPNPSTPLTGGYVVTAPGGQQVIITD